jgi:signal peptidase
LIGAREILKSIKKSSNLSIIKKILNLLSIAITVCIVVFSLVVTLDIIISRKNGGTPKIGNFTIYEIVSGSMEPDIPVGSIVIDRITDAKALKIGDVISFYNKSSGSSIVVTHRIDDIYKQSNGQIVFTTKGDANKTSDSNSVTAENIIGRVGIHIPYVGYAINFVTTKAGLFITVIGPLMILLITEIVSMFVRVNLMLNKKKPKKVQS